MARIISQDTAYAIWMAHREIEVGGKLIADLRDTIERDEKATPDDPYNRQRNLQLGVPSGSGHRLLMLEPELAVIIVEEHIAKQRALLVKLCDDVLNELLRDEIAR